MLRRYTVSLSVAQQALYQTTLAISIMVRGNLQIVIVSQRGGSCSRHCTQNKPIATFGSEQTSKIALVE